MRTGLACVFLVAAWANAGVVNVGQGSYTTDLPPGAKAPPATLFQTAAVTSKMPTNTWWSSLAWTRFSDRQYPHPLAVEAVPAGLRIAYPGAHITANKTGIFAAMPAPRGEDLLLGHSNVSEFPDARVDGWNDWFVSAKFAAGDRSMTLTYGHGSPFVYATYTGGAARITFAAPPKVWSGNANSPILGITVGGTPYALFGPTGSTWAGWGTNTLTNVSDKTYFSLALLPSADETTLHLFQRYAYAHIVNTKVSWNYTRSQSTLTTTFSFTTHPYEGDEQGTLFALYPHQWRHASAQLTGHTYASIRGLMKLAAGTGFNTTLRFPGILPALPKVDSADPGRMATYLRQELAHDPPRGFHDTYWEGKWLGKQADLAAIAWQYNAPESKTFDDRLRQRLESWFTAIPDKRTGLFYYDKTWGTLIGYPAGYGSDDQLNDHHFHYGYFLRAAAEIARTNPAWAGKDNFGGMVHLLISDIANPDRQNPRFPFLRCFDPYAGHSWASGHAKFGDGNNQESSSEAMNAWYGLILWADATGDTSLRDLGIYLYTTELSAIQEYWFDTTGENFPTAYTPAAVGMVWGGKSVFATWFSGDAEAVYGINYLPLHAGSLYLALDPAYARRSYESLLASRKGNDWKIWWDLFAMYRALSDPADALSQLQSHTQSPEAGNSLANAYAWITCFQALGAPDPTITADLPEAVAFQKDTHHTYIAHNPTPEARMVHFSDGTEFIIPPRTLAVHSR